VEQHHVWIAMEDGTRLAARLFLPDELPAPAIVDALPYRMDDLTASYAREYERLCEEGGFAVCRIDLRGTGSSEGIALDEYHPQEQADLCEAISWLASQEWCTGRVGMYGTSWGGFNSIQVAMERPPALHAIVPIYASDDRYTDDVHYMGGVVKQLDQVDYPSYMVALNALPPVPGVYGEGWREHLGEFRHNQAVLGVFTTPGGGTVVNAGVTDWAYGLRGEDPILEQVTRNVVGTLSV